MALMLYQTRGYATMVATGLGDDGDDRSIRRDDPGRFPVYAFKRLVSLSAYYRANGRHGEVGGDTFFGIPWAAIERAELADVATAMTRVIGDRVRHGFTAKHFPVWLAMECGIVLLEGKWSYAFPDKARKVLDDYETARTFGVSEATAREYRNVVTRALDDQWYWIKTREK
jgi:hypothetical protein